MNASIQPNATPLCKCGHERNMHMQGSLRCAFCECTAYTTGKRRRRASRKDVASTPQLGRLDVASARAAAIALAHAAMAFAEILAAGVVAPSPPIVESLRRMPRASLPVTNGAPAHPKPRRPVAQSDRPESLGLGAERVLHAIAQRSGMTRIALRTVTGYKRSTVDSFLKRLANRGLVERDDHGAFHATKAGMDELGPEFVPLPKGAALRAHWLQPGRLPEGESVVLELLCNAYPSPVARALIEQATGYARSSRDSFIKRLKSRALVVVLASGDVRASPTLFEEG